MTFCVEEMKKKIASVLGENSEALFEKRCLRSTRSGKQNCTTIQMPVDKELRSMRIQTRSTKPNNYKKVLTELQISSKPVENKHYLRSTATKTKQPPKVESHRKLSEDEKTPQKRSRKDKINMKSPIAKRTRSALLKQ